MQTKSVFSDKLMMTFIKLPMMVKDADECKTTLDRWIYLLKNMEKMEAIPHTFAKEPVFRRLAEKAKYAALTQKERKAYQESLKVYRDNYAIAETERAIGREEGRAEGIAIGEAKGKAEGRASAIAEKIKEARGMGLPEDIISRLFNS